MIIRLLQVQRCITLYGGKRVTLLKMLKAFLLISFSGIICTLCWITFQCWLIHNRWLLRTFGLEQIKMGLWYGVDLPVMFSIPFSLLIALLLFFCATYIKRSIVFVYQTFEYRAIKEVSIFLGGICLLSTTLN